MWLFEADLGHLIDQGTVTVYYLQNPALHAGNGALVTTDHPGRYVLAVEYHPDRGEKPDDFTPERAAEQVRAAVGIPDLPVRILHSDETEFAARVADRFSLGRVHLIGDAARSPRYSSNSSTPISCTAWRPTLPTAARRPPSTRQTLFLGYRYPTGAVVGEPNDNGSLLEDPSTPTGRPGSRAPHVPLVRDGVPISTIDLFGSSFVLLTGSHGQPWRQAADEVAHRLGIQLAVSRPGTRCVAPWYPVCRALVPGVRALVTIDGRPAAQPTGSTVGTIIGRRR